MRPFRIVSDSSCLIALAQIRKFEILKELFFEIFIPEAVYYEVVVKGKGEVGSEETETAIKNGWISRKRVKDKIAVKALSMALGSGEAEAIILSKELNVDYVLIDEGTAREKAEIMNVSVMGTLGVLDLAIEKGFQIDKKKLVDQLIELGFRISDRLYRRMFPDSK